MPYPVNTVCFESISGYEMNCWGAVIYFFEGKEKSWAGTVAITDFINNKTIPLAALKKNCIYAMYCPKTRGLVHMAIYLGFDLFWHKPGSGDTEVISKEELHKKYKEDLSILYFGKPYEIVLYEYAG
jgi:hypothetical protein